MSFKEEWDNIKIKNLCKKIYSGGTPSRKKQRYFKDGDINWIKTKELNDNNIYNSEEKITQEALENSSAKLFPQNTVLIAMYGATVSKLGVLKIKATTNQACCGLICDEEKIDHEFLFYSLLFNRNKIKNLSNGAAQQNINVGIIKNFEINVPPLKKQKKIINILSSLDQKIENNNQMNQTLEEMAQGIYKNWFIDFEPFQNEKFIESELGLIPESWEVVSLHSLANYVNGGSFPQRILSKEIKGLPVIKISELNSNGVTNNTKYYNKDDYRKKYELQTGDVLFAWSASLGIYLWSNGKALLNQHIYNVKPTDRVSKEILYFILQEVIDEFISIAAARATTMGHITKTHLKQKKIAIPPGNVLDDLDKIIKPIFNKILNNNIENKSLKELRDTLLPKLMSGEIRVTSEK